MLLLRPLLGAQAFGQLSVELCVVGVFRVELVVSQLGLSTLAFGFQLVG